MSRPPMLFLDEPVVGGATASDIWNSVAWDLGILVVFAPLAVRLYRRAI